MKAKLLFVPKQKVYHKVCPQRLTMCYLVKRAWWEEITDCVTFFNTGISQTVLKILIRRFGRMVASIVKIFSVTKICA